MKKIFTTVLILVVVFIMAGVSMAELTDGLLGYYPFNGNANDESGNGNNADINGPTLISDRHGNANSAYHFNGDANQMEISNLGSPSQATFCGWFRQDDSLSISSIYKIYDTCGADGIQIENGKLAFHLEVGRGNYNVFTTTQSVNDNIWHFFTVTYDGQNIKYFLDSNELHSIENSASIDYDGCGRFYIGTHWSSGYQHENFIGDLDDFRIYNRVLSDTEIQQIYNEGSETCNYTDSDNDGVIDSIDKCPDTASGSYTDKDGCPASGLYTQEQLNNVISEILLWGDIDGDKKISLSEAVHALQVTSGITEPAIK